MIHAMHAGSCQCAMSAQVRGATAAPNVCLSPGHDDSMQAVRPGSLARFFDRGTPQSVLGSRQRMSSGGRDG
jgi:hypothetical protein